LPLNLEPEIEAQIERVLILADQPVMRRPIAAATVLDALPKACKVDPALCERVGAISRPVTPTPPISRTPASRPRLHTARTDPSRPLWPAQPQRLGCLRRGILQPSDYLLVAVGPSRMTVARSTRFDAQRGVSARRSFDIGYKPHWFSPLTDSSMLMSTEAPTMPR